MIGAPESRDAAAEQLQQDLLRLEMRAEEQTGWLLAATILAVNLLVIQQAALPEAPVRAFIQLASATFLVWFAGTALLIRRGWYRAWFTYFNVVVQVSAVSFALLGAARLVGLDHPIMALLPLFYLLVVGLTALTLNPLLCLLAGGFAVGQYLGAYGWWLSDTTGVDWTGVYLRALIILAMSLGALLIAYRARRLLEQLAGQVRAQERLRTLEWEMERAAEVQERLIPQQLPAPGFLDVESWYRPSGQVGGDFFDLVARSDGDGRWVLLVGDVAGKGYGAALTAAGIQSTARVLIERGASLEELLHTLNDMLHQVAVRGGFASLAAMELDARGETLRYANGGHNPPLLVRNGGEVVRLQAQGPVLGVLPQQRYPSEALPLAAGDLLFAYTDGLTELRSPDGSQWGEQRLIDLLRGSATANLRHLRERLLAVIDEHLQHGAPADDISFVCVRKRAPEDRGTIDSGDWEGVRGEG